MTRVRTGSRLHFGLFHLPPAEPWPTYWPGTHVPARYYGGVGVMIEEPAVVVDAEPADQWTFIGPDADRVRGVVSTGRPHAVRIVQTAPAHAGFGSGTQLALAAAQAISERQGVSPPDAGRGRRSAIGIHGFAHGGLILDGGKRHANELGALIGAYAVPEPWRFVCVTPPGETRWSGDEERDALARVAPHDATPDDALFRLAVFGIVPAALSNDIAAFGAAVTEFNARVGDRFAAVQGGRYSTPATAAAVLSLLELGALGAGQSSWGPTAFGVVGNPEQADYVAQRLRLASPRATIRISAACRLKA